VVPSFALTFTPHLAKSAAPCWSTKTLGIKSSKWHWMYWQLDGVGAVPGEGLGLVGFRLLPEVEEKVGLFEGLLEIGLLVGLLVVGEDVGLDEGLLVVGDDSGEDVGLDVGSLAVGSVGKLAVGDIDGAGTGTGTGIGAGTGAGIENDTNPRPSW
jgi:hypothetical protein